MKVNAKRLAKEKPRKRMFKIKLKSTPVIEQGEKWICYYEKPPKLYTEPEIVVIPYKHHKRKALSKVPNVCYTLVSAEVADDAAIKARRQFILRHAPAVGNVTLQKAINNHFEHSVKSVTQAVHDANLIVEINKMALRYCHFVRVEQTNPSPTSRTRKVRNKVKARKVGTLRLSGWFSWYYDLAKKVNASLLNPGTNL